MKILFIIPWIPYPLNSGGAQAFFNMVNEIRKKHSVTLLLTIRCKNDEENVNRLKAVWNDVDIRSYDARKESAYDDFRAYIKSTSMGKLTAMSCKWMYKTQQSLKRKINRRIDRQQGKNLQTIIRKNSTLFNNINLLTPGFLNFVKKVTLKGFEITQIEFYEYLPLVHILPQNTKTVFVHHEIRFIHNENELSVMNDVTPHDRIMLEEEKAKEIYNLSKYDHIIVLTNTDRNILKKLLPNSDIYISPAITMASLQTNKALNFKPANELVFMGNSSHIPNIEGLTWFCSNVMPAVSNHNKDTKLYVTGNWNDNSKKIIKSIYPDIIFTGFVEDISSFINGKISIIPIRIGSGTRMKAIDAMMSFSPIVTTSKGCEGLMLENRKDVMYADKPLDFADAIIELLNNQELQRLITTNAIKKISTSLNSKEMLDTRLNFYNSITL